mgnify:CR=1 FL=1
MKLFYTFIAAVAAIKNVDPGTIYNFLFQYFYIQYSLPDCYKNCQKRYNSPGIFSGLILLLAVFFRKLDKKS